MANEHKLNCLGNHFSSIGRAQYICTANLTLLCINFVCTKMNLPMTSKPTTSGEMAT